MQPYHAAVLNAGGNPISNVSVLVYLAGTTTPAALFSTDTFTAKSNPFLNDPDGAYTFYAGNGRYDIQVAASDREMTKLHDALDRAASIVIHGSRVRHGLTDLQARLAYRIIDDTQSESAAAAQRLPGRGGRR